MVSDEEAGDVEDTEMKRSDEHLLAILVAPMLGKMSGLDSMDHGYVPESREVKDAVNCAIEALHMIKDEVSSGNV